MARKEIKRKVQSKNYIKCQEGNISEDIRSQLLWGGKKRKKRAKAIITYFC